MPYVGQLVEIPAGVGTLTSDNNAANSRFIDLVVAEGIVSERGVWEREPGATPFFATGLAPGISASATLSPATVWTAAAVSFVVDGALQFIDEFAGQAVNPLVTALDVGGPVLGADLPSGSFAIVAVAHDTSVAVTTVDDLSGQGLTWTQAISQTGPSVDVEIWYAHIPTTFAAPPEMARFNLSGPSNGVTTGALFNGIRQVTPLDKAVGDSGASALAATAVSSAVTEPLELVYAYVASKSGAVTTFPATFTQFTEVFNLAIPNTRARAAWREFDAADASPDVIALADYWTTTATQRLLALGSDGVLYKSSGGFFTPITMASTMQDTYGAMIVVGGQETAGAPRKAFVFDNGNTRIQTLSGDGVATTDFGNGWDTTTNIPLDWAVNPPRGAVIHKERLWPWAPANAPHNIYASRIGDHENFKNAVGGQFEYVQEIGTGTGIEIAAAASFKGMLFVFKYPRGIWFLDDTDVDYLNWRWNLVSDAVGVANSPHSVLVLDDDVMFVDPNGHIHFLSAVTQQGVRTSDLTAALNLQQYTRENINLTRLSQITSVWYPAKKLAMIGVPPIGSEQNGLRYYFDFSTATEAGQTVRISYTYRDVNRVLAIRQDEIDGIQKPIFADENGLVWKMDQPNKTKTGFPNAGQARYQYSATDFSHLATELANKRKLFDAMTINFNPVGQWNLGVDSIIDGEYHETLYFSMGGGTSVLGTFRFGERFGGGSIQTNRRRMTGHGYWLGIGGFVSGEGHDFSVAKHIINFRVGGEEQR